MAGLIVTGVLVSAAVALILWIRKLSKANNVMLVTQARANAKADAAAEAAERITGVAQQALDVGRATRVTEQALNVAQEIHNVSRKVDELLDEEPSGRHALRAVPDERYIA